MKALKLIELGKAQVTDDPIAGRAGDDAMTVRVEACGVCGTDRRIFGHGSARVSYPRVLGHEIAGTVATPPASRPELAGARVVLAPPAIACGTCPPCLAGRANLCKFRNAYGYELDGGLAEEMVIPSGLAARLSAVPVPDSVPSWLATLAEPVSCCLNGQERLGDISGGWVVIYGAGFIGRTHALLARLAGARTVLVDPDAERLAAVEADATVHNADGPAASRAAAIVGDDLAAIVIACSDPSVHEDAAELASPGCKVLLFAGSASAATSWPANLVHYSELQLIGSFAALPAHVEQAVGLLGGPLAALARDVQRLSLDEVPDLLAGRLRLARPKVVVEI